MKKYIKAENPITWLFNGKTPGSKYSTRGLSWVMRENLKNNNGTPKSKLKSSKIKGYRGRFFKSAENRKKAAPF